MAAKTEQQILKEAGNLVQKQLRDELDRQGHRLTGRLQRSITNRVTIRASGSFVEGTALPYGFILNDGTSAARVPFRQGSGASTSKYIEGLKTFFRLRGLEAEEAERAAFATAKKQKKEGMPTEASKRFSSTGQRTGFIDTVNQAVDQKVHDIILGGYSSLINETFRETGNEDF